MQGKHLELLLVHQNIDAQGVKVFIGSESDRAVGLRNATRCVDILGRQWVGPGIDCTWMALIAVPLCPLGAVDLLKCLILSFASCSRGQRCLPGVGGGMRWEISYVPGPARVVVCDAIEMGSVNALK